MKQPIVFAFYKNDQLIGYRLDTIGSISKEVPPKIYYYSKSQVDTVLENIQFNVKNRKAIGNILGSDELAEHEAAIHDLLKDKKIFEVRVLKSPGYPIEKRFDVETAEWVEERTWEYPLEEVIEWMDNPQDHEMIETHWFGMNGLINLQ